MGEATSRAGEHLNGRLAAESVGDVITQSDELPLLRSGKIQMLVPIFNEGANVIRLYEELEREKVAFDSLKFIYDIDSDTSLPFVAQLREQDLRVQAEKNEFGRGVINALRWGLSHCESGPVVVVMGDSSDSLFRIPEMIEHWRRGAVLVSPSRYTRGGQQIGGPLLKKTLSRIAGTSLALLGLPTSDPTNNFKLYDGDWVRAQQIESVGGFELALELVYKALVQGKSIQQVPTIWRDRTEGQSNFRLWAWLPHYLTWYRRILLALLRARKRKVQ